MASLTYLVNGSTIQLQVGDICVSNAEVLVSSDDSDLSMGGGVSRALLKRAGPGLQLEARKHLPTRLGDVVTTSGGNSAARYILHGITIDFHRHVEDRLPGSPQEQKSVVVRRIVNKALGLLPLLGCNSIAFPALGAGVAGIDLETVVREMVGAVVRVLLDAPRALTVEICLLTRFGHGSDEELFTSFKSYLERTLALHAASVSEGGAAMRVPPVDAASRRSVQPSSATQLRQIFEALRLLDARQAAVEGQLLEALVTNADAATATAADRLRRIKTLRRGYEESRDAVIGHEANSAGNGVFLSSTYEDLKPHRIELRKTIESLPLPFIGMEDFHPNEKLPVEFIRQELKKAGIYFGVLGMRYGSIDQATGQSMTELEYEQAVLDKMKICIFLIAPDAQIKVQMVDSTAEGFEKLLRLKQRITASHVCGFFHSVEDLTTKARKALTQLSADGRWDPDELSAA